MKKINTLIMVALVAILSGCASSTKVVRSGGASSVPVSKAPAQPSPKKAKQAQAPAADPAPQGSGQQNWASQPITQDDINQLRAEIEMLRAERASAQSAQAAPAPAPAQSSGNGYSWGNNNSTSWGASPYSGGNGMSVPPGMYNGRRVNGELEVLMPDSHGITEENKNYVSSKNHTRTRVVKGYVTELGGNDLPPVPPEHVFTFTDGSSGRSIRKYSHGNSSASLVYNPVTDTTTITEYINSHESEENTKPQVWRRPYKLGDGFNSRSGQFQRDPEPGRLLNTLKGK